MSKSAKTHYDTLGLKIDASFAEIKSQYRKLLLQVKLCYSTILVYLFTQTDEIIVSNYPKAGWISIENVGQELTNNNKVCEYP